MSDILKAHQWSQHSVVQPMTKWDIFHIFFYDLGGWDAGVSCNRQQHLEITLLCSLSNVFSGAPRYLLWVDSSSVYFFHCYFVSFINIVIPNCIYSFRFLLSLAVSFAKSSNTPAGSKTSKYLHPLLFLIIHPLSFEACRRAAGLVCKKTIRRRKIRGFKFLRPLTLMARRRRVWTNRRKLLLSQ